MNTFINTIIRFFTNKVLRKFFKKLFLICFFMSLSFSLFAEGTEKEWDCGGESFRMTLDTLSDPTYDLYAIQVYYEPGLYWISQASWLKNKVGGNDQYGGDWFGTLLSAKQCGEYWFEEYDPNSLTQDFDGDGIPNYYDDDDDGDGIPDTLDIDPYGPDGYVPDGNGDFDGDGIIDSLDPDWSATDWDGDGIPNDEDPYPLIAGHPAPDTSGTGLNDVLDYDIGDEYGEDRPDEPGDATIDTNGDGVVDANDLFNKATIMVQIENIEHLLYYRLHVDKVEAIFAPISGSTLSVTVDLTPAGNSMVPVLVQPQTVNFLDLISSPWYLILRLAVVIFIFYYWVSALFALWARF